MGNTLTGVNGQPVYNTTPSTVVDMQAGADYAAEVGNRKKGTAAQRTALSGVKVWDGLEFFETDTGLRFLRKSGTWIRLGTITARLTKSAAQSTSATAGAFTSVTWDVETFDPEGMHDPSSNPSRITVPVSGDYRINSHLRTAVAGSHGIALSISGTRLQETETFTAFASGAFADPRLTELVYLTAGQYIEILTAHTVASTVLLTAWCTVDVELVRAR